MTAISIDSRAVAASLGQAPPRTRRGHSYRAVVLMGLAKLWRGRGAHVLDVGGGDGRMAQAMFDQLPVRGVTSVDVVDRFRRDLDVATRVFDGRRLPFAEAAFDAATLIDVLRFVAPADRVVLLREIARTTAGPLYIKDRVGGSAPSADAWRALASASGWRVAAKVRARYRTGVMALLFPNRNEVSMRWER